MDTSVFADLDTRHVEVAEGDHCLDRDLKLPIAAVIAVVRHIAIFGLLVFSLLALAIVYCFTLTWLLLLWFQAQLLVFTAHLLSSTMEEPLPKRQAGCVPDDRETVTLGDIATKQGMTSPRSPQAAEFLPILEQDAPTNTKDTSSQLSDLEPANHSKKETHRESERSTTLDLLLSENTSSKNTSTQQEVDPDNVTTATEERKNLQEDKRSREQSLFVSMMLNRPNESTGATFPAGYETNLGPQRINPFNITPQNLAEARSFSAEVSRPGTRTARGAARVFPARAHTAPKPVIKGPAIADPSMSYTRSSPPEGWIPPHKRKTRGTQAQKPAAAVVIDAAVVESGVDTISAETEAISRPQSFLDNDTPQAMFRQHNIQNLSRGASVTNATMPLREPELTQDGSEVATSPDTYNSPLFDLTSEASDDYQNGAQEQEYSIKSMRGTSELQREVHHGAAATKAAGKCSMSNADLNALAIESAVGDELVSRLQSARHTMLCTGNPCTASNCEHKNTSPPRRDSLGLKQEQANSNGIDKAAHGVQERLAQNASLAELDPANTGPHSHHGNGQISTDIPTNSPTAGERAVEPQRDADVVQLSIMDMPEYCDLDPLSFTVKRSLGTEWKSHTFHCSTETQQPAPSLAMPPGLRHAVDRQAEFDALLPDVKPATSERDATHKSTGDSDLSHLRLEFDCASGSGVILTDTAANQSAQTEPGIKELDPYTSRASAVQDVDPPRKHKSVTKPGGEDGIPGGMNDAVVPEVEESETEIAIAASKRQARDMRKAARSLLKRGWLAREIARKKVLVSGFACDVAQILAPATRSYLSYRSELEKLMPGGCLNDEDAKIYPVFSETELAEPKARPKGLQNLQDIETIDVAAAAQVEPPLDENVVDKAKTSLATARKLHIGALDYFKHRDHSMQYAVWKSKGDNKLKRATAYYTKKREALVSVYGASDLPAEMKDLFPPL